MTSKTDRIVALVERFVKAGELAKARAVSRVELADVEKEIGRPLPATYRALMERVGAIGKDEEPRFHGWSYDHKVISGPKEALALTKKLRAEWGKDGRHVGHLERTFFFVTWEVTYEHYGVDDAGNVRKLRHNRPGTLLKVEAKSIDDLLAAKLGELAERTETTDDSEDATDLVVDEGESLGPVMKRKSLERLTVRGIDDGKVLAILGKHPTLRALAIEWGEVDDLPDALFLAPALEKVDLGRTPAAKRYGAGLDGLLEWLQKEEIAPKLRPLYVRLLVDDTAWIEKNAKAEDLLAALDAPNDRVADAAHRALAKHLAPPKSLEGAHVALLGKSRTKADALAAQLETAGAKAEKKIGPKTTHVLVGVRPKEGWREAKKKKLPLLHETHLIAQLDKKGARYLASKEAKTEAPSRLRELLLGPDAANVDLAISMMERGGVPDGVLEAMLLVIQNPEMPAKTRKALEVLASTQYPELPRIIRDVLARTNLYQCGATKLADRLALLDKKSKGKISGRRIALDLLAKDKEDQRALLYAFETGDAAFAAEAIALARGPNELDLGGLEARIGPAIDKVAPAFAKFAGIDSLSLQWTYLREVPKAIAKLSSLKKLTLADNDLKTLPDALASLTALEELDIGSNRMSELPPVVAKLHALRVVRAPQDEDKPRLRSLPESLASLPKLERIELEGQKGVFQSPVLTTLRARGVDVITS